MSDTKKPTVSEIVAFQRRRPVGGEDYEPSMSLREIFLYDNCDYLLDLVERMGKLAELVLAEVNPVNVLGPPEVTHEMEKKARALLKELKQ